MIVILLLLCIIFILFSKEFLDIFVETVSELQASVWAVVDWQSRPSVARRRTVNFHGVLLTEARPV